MFTLDILKIRIYKPTIISFNIQLTKKTNLNFFKGAAEVGGWFKADDDMVVLMVRRWRDERDRDRARSTKLNF